MPDSKRAISAEISAVRARAFLAAAADLDPVTLKRMQADQFDDVLRAACIVRGNVAEEAALRRLRDGRRAA